MRRLVVSFAMALGEGRTLSTERKTPISVNTPGNVLARRKVLACGNYSNRSRRGYMDCKALSIRGCVFSASLGQIGPAAAGTAYQLGQFLDDLAGVELWRSGPS